ncbi:MAG TPA: hypothetical protein VMV53_11745 [Acidimicrobiales bacterium]|nr:hypothetical protein [Acidimicrobiales bacterium]
MTLLSTAEGFDVLEHGVWQFEPGHSPLVVQELDLRARLEGHQHRIVERVSHRSE